MKKFLSIGLLLGLISASYTTFGQIQMMNEMTITPPAYHSLEYNNLYDLLHASVEYPASAINNAQQGTELIRFSVTSYGSIEDIDIINSVSREIDQELTRILLSTSNKWTPGTVDGEPVDMKWEVSVIFALTSYEDMLKLAQGYMQRGNKLLHTKNKPEKAFLYFNLVYALFPNESNVLLLKGHCLDRMGQTEEAMKIIEELKVQANNTGAKTFPAEEKTLYSDNYGKPMLVLAR